jgi:hypothetical protein
MKAFLLDVDWTLAPSNNEDGTLTMLTFLKARLGGKSTEFRKKFEQMFSDFNRIHLGEMNPALEARQKKINSYSVKVPAGAGRSAFIWSRELWLKILAEELELDLNGNAIMAAIDNYWKGRSSVATIYPDAIKFLSTAPKNTRFFAATASDDRLKFVGDRIIYDPAYSEQKKIERIMMQGLGRFFKPEQIITGDPYNKPSEEYWEKCIARTGTADITLIDDNLLVLQFAKEFGFQCFLIDRNRNYDKKIVVPNGISYITSLEEIRL